MGLRDNEGRIKRGPVIGGLLVLILIAVGGVIYANSQGSFQDYEKKMAPEYVTWKYSSHSQIACEECHSPSDGGSTSTELTNDVCETCHSVSNRNFTLSGDLIIPHEQHGQKGVNCVQCHSGVAHGNITARAITTGGETSGAWSDSQGKENMNAQFIRPDMDACVSCHMDPATFGIEKVKSVTWACEACHKNIYTPQSHKASNWFGVHGLDAERGINGCVGCHAIGGKIDYKANGIVNVAMSNPSVQDYVWKTKFCIDCHSQKPWDHADKAQWMPMHGTVVANKQLKNCTACHSIQQPKAGETLKSPAKFVSCNNCHWFK